jgi:curved DNA-binding protein CbpA
MLNFDNRHYYNILKVGNHATRKEITASYSRLVKEHNPDGKSFHSQSLKQKAQEKFKLIDEAYQTLSNPIKRAEYDAFLDDPLCEEDVGVDTKTKEEYSDDDEANKLIINCPKCDQRLRVLSGESLSVTCSSCSHTFDYQGKYQECQPEDSHETPKTQPKDTKAETPSSEKRESTSQPYENRKKLNYICKHWRGELSLAISFWVNVCLINIIIMSLVNWFVQNSPIDHPVISARVIFIIVISSLFVFTWQIVGLWRSCDRHVVVSDRAFWARTAQAMVVLCLVANLGNIASYWGIYKEVYQVGFQKDTTPAYTLSLRKNDSLIHLEGGLRFGVSKDVASLLKGNPDIGGIILDCSGGRIYEGRELSKLILIYGLDTYSLKGCYSAGTVAFISGTNRFLGTGATLGFHQYHMGYDRLDEFVDVEEEQEKDLLIFKRKDIKKEFLEKLYTSSAEDLWFPSREELLSAGVIHGVVNPSDLTPLEHMEDIDVREEFLDIPVYRTIQKYEPEIFEQIIADINEQYKNGSTLVKLQEVGASHFMVLGQRLLPKSSNETLVGFTQTMIDALRELVEDDPLLCLKWLYPERFGTLDISKYLSHEVQESFGDVVNVIITDAYEKEIPLLDFEAVELQIQNIALQLGDDALYLANGHEELQSSDQYKRYCDAQINFFELILAEDKRIAANILRYMFAQLATDDSASEGDNYDGDIVDGKRHGYGTYNWPSGENAGDKYVGEFQNDKLHGRGTYTWDGGDKYVGEFKDNMRSGQGTNTWISGDKYVGEWKDNMRNGQGREILANGTEYIGNWKDGFTTGQGIITHPDGEKYEGEWKEGVRSGRGTNTWTDGEKYVGEWNDNMMNGQGTYFYTKDEKYIGEFKNSNAVGGWYYWSDGSKKWAYTDTQGNLKFQNEDDSGAEKSDNLKSKDTEINNITPDMQFVQQRLGEPHSIEKDSTTERWNYGSSYVEFKEGIYFRCYEPHGKGDLYKKLNIK